MNEKLKLTARKRRHKRVRAKIIGTKETPRISVFKSGRHIYIQAVDDEAGRTIFSMNDVETKSRRLEKSGPRPKASGEKNKTGKSLDVGRALGEALKKGGISKAVFDRGGFKYHGRVKSLAEGLRESGIKI